MSAMNGINLQPGGMLATAAAHITLELFNATLQSDGLCLPIAPLERGLTLADLVARNAGGRRQLRYGTIARYLRAVTVQPDQSTERKNGTEVPLLTLGGPTLKRATGYALQRAVVGGYSVPGFAPLLHDITVNVRPLPAARCALLLVCNDLSAACRAATSMLSAGLALSALAFLKIGADERDEFTFPLPPTADKSVILLLAELEGTAVVVERHAAQVVGSAAQAGCTVLTTADSADAVGDLWSIWEQREAAWRSDTTYRLDLTLPRMALPQIVQYARDIAHRYRLDIHIWGDVGVGRLHLRFAARSHTRLLREGEFNQIAALIISTARQAGGSLSTECGQQHPVDLTHLPVSPLHHPVPRLSRSAFLERVREIVGPSSLVTRPHDLLCYAEDASIAQAEGVPLAAALPASTSEVSALLRLAMEAHVPVVTRGAGSGLAGGATPTKQALLLVLTRMQHLRIDAARSIALVEAGTATTSVQQAAAAHNLFYPPDPSSQPVSTIGGNIACNAGGPRCLKYGVTGDYVVGLTSVLADGSILRVGDGLNAQTPDAGLLHLLTGSEGTLAVITEATLRLIPQPAARRTALAIFDQLDDACAAVEAMMAAGLLPASLELLDDTTIKVVEDYLHLGLPTDAGALLLLMADGEPEAVAWEAQVLADLARRSGARDVQVAQNSEDEAALWRARRSISPALARVRPNKLGEDICVPVSQVAAAVRHIKAIAARYRLPIPVFGHAGDGNLHPNIVFDARDAAEAHRAWHAAEEIFLAALELGGTLSGEHGIGTLKRPFLERALGSEVLALHYTIKAAFDPQNCLNPGKLLPLQAAITDR